MSTSESTFLSPGPKLLQLLFLLPVVIIILLVLLFLLPAVIIWSVLLFMLFVCLSIMRLATAATSAAPFPLPSCARARVNCNTETSTGEFKAWSPVPVGLQLHVGPA